MGQQDAPTHPLAHTPIPLASPSPTHPSPWPLPHPSTHPLASPSPTHLVCGLCLQDAFHRINGAVEVIIEAMLVVAREEEKQDLATHFVPHARLEDLFFELWGGTGCGLRVAGCGLWVVRRRMVVGDRAMGGRQGSGLQAGEPASRPDGEER